MKNKLKKIKMLVLDVDGVLTDGKIIMDDDGKEYKNFDVQDGFGLALMRRAGFKTAFITGKGSNVVKARAKQIKIDKVYLDAYPKINVYKKLLKTFKVKDDQICYMGDDIFDMRVLERVGFAATVPNARPEVKKICDYVTKKKGGHGAVREVIELILKAQGKWKKIVDKE